MPTEYEKGAKYISNNTQKFYHTGKKNKKKLNQNIVDFKPKKKKKNYATIANNFKRRSISKKRNNFFFLYFCDDFCYIKFGM